MQQSSPVRRLHWSLRPRVPPPPLALLPRLFLGLLPQQPRPAVAAHLRAPLQRGRRCWLRRRRLPLPPAQPPPPAQPHPPVQPPLPVQPPPPAQPRVRPRPLGRPKRSPPLRQAAWRLRPWPPPSRPWRRPWQRVPCPWPPLYRPWPSPLLPLSPLPPCLWPPPSRPWPSPSQPASLLPPWTWPPPSRPWPSPWSSARRPETWPARPSPPPLRPSPDCNSTKKSMMHIQSDRETARSNGWLCRPSRFDQRPSEPSSGTAVNLALSKSLGPCMFAHLVIL